MDVKGCFSDVDNAPVIVGGRYGLGSKDTNSADITAVFVNLKQKSPKTNFTIGIVDDVTNTSLEKVFKASTEPSDLISCKFWGLGSDGTVGSNKQAIMIIGNKTQNQVQAYFDYTPKN